MLKRKGRTIKMPLHSDKNIFDPTVAASASIASNIITTTTAMVPKTFLIVDLVDSSANAASQTPLAILEPPTLSAKAAPSLALALVLRLSPKVRIQNSATPAQQALTFPNET